MSDGRTQIQSLTGETKDLQLLECLFNNSECGVTIIDKQFRYVRINETLAKINRLPAEFHIGKTVREVLGDVATQIERELEAVFSTGERVDNYHLVAKLPTRPRDGRWNVSYFPMKDHNGTVTQVCAIVTELEEDRSRDRYYRRPTLPLPLPPPPEEHGARVVHSLTKRELQVVQSLASGKSNKEIAVALGISVKTVEHHRTNLMYKLNTHSLVDLLRFAASHKLVELG